MKGPQIRNTVRDKKNNVTYHIMADRALSREEMLVAVGQYHAQPGVRRRKMPLRNKVITILTLFGASPGL